MCKNKTDPASIAEDIDLYLGRIRFRPLTEGRKDGQGEPVHISFIFISLLCKDIYIE